MKRKTISKKTREQAALICDVAASARHMNHDWFTVEIAAGLGIPRVGVASRLAANARSWVNAKIYRSGVWNWSSHVAAAEAAQLLRDGWSPR